MKRPLIAVVVLALAALAWFLWPRGHDAAPPPPTTARPVSPPTTSTTPTTTEAPAEPSRDGVIPRWALDVDPEGPLRLEGQVVGKDGKGVGGAEVTLESVPPRTTKSEDDGTFSFDKLVGRRYEVSARTATMVGGPVPYKLTATSDPVVITLEEAAAVTVTVTDEAKKPLAGATVTLEAHDLTATTDDKGKAQLAPVGTGFVLASAIAPGYAAGSAVGQVGSGGATLGLAITLRKGAAVSGKVVDEAGAPIARARVSPASNGGMFPTLASNVATTDAQGAFAFPALGPGGYTLNVADGQHAPTAVTVTVAAAPVAGVVVTMKAGGVVRGIVVDRDGKPAPFATVRVAGAGKAMFEADRRQATGDDKARFEVRGLPRIAMSVRAESDTAASQITPVDLAARAEIADLKLVLDVSGTIAGTVVDEAGAPVAEVTVNAFPDLLNGASGAGIALGAMVSATTDGSGAFTLRGLPDGAYRLWASRGGGGTGRRGRGGGGQESTSAKTGDKGVKLTLASPGALVARLALPGGGAPTMATVQAGLGATTPVSGGQVALKDLAPGNYDVTFRGLEFAELTRRDVKIEPGKTTDLGTVTLARGRKLTGKVVDGTGAPIADAQVKVGAILLSSGNAGGAAGGMDEMMGIRSTTSDADGSFVIIGVPALPTNVMADHPDHGRSVAQVIPEGTDDPPALTLTLKGFGSIVGKVTKKGEPQGGVTVSESTQGGGAQASFVRTGADGSFTMDKVPEGTHVLMAMQTAMMSATTTNATVNVVAGKQASVVIDIPVGEVTVEIVVHPLPGQQVDAAQVFWFHGVVGATNGKQLTELFLGGGGGGSGSAASAGAGGMKFWFGGAAPAPTFDETVPGDYTACVVPITGSMSDPTFMQRIQQNIASLKVYCKQVKVMASPLKQSFTVDTPAMTPLPMAPCGRSRGWRSPTTLAGSHRTRRAWSGRAMDRGLLELGRMHVPSGYSLMALGLVSSVGCLGTLGDNDHPTGCPTERVVVHTVAFTTCDAARVFAARDTSDLVPTSGELQRYVNRWLRAVDTEPALTGRRPLRSNDPPGWVGLVVDNDQVTGAWARGQTYTGLVAFDTVLASLGPVSPSQTGASSPSLWSLDVSVVYNEDLLARLLEPLGVKPEVNGDFTNGFDGTWAWADSTLPSGSDDATARIDLKIGWGDCFSGCLYDHSIRLVVPPTGDAIEYDLGGDPIEGLNPNRIPLP
jgi:protocatechuate 3,4-dioxygenase beta subunit